MEHRSIECRHPETHTKYHTLISDRQLNGVYLYTHTHIQRETLYSCVCVVIVYLCTGMRAIQGAFSRLQVLFPDDDQWRTLILNVILHAYTIYALDELAIIKYALHTVNIGNVLIGHM